VAFTTGREMDFAINEGKHSFTKKQEDFFLSHWGFFPEANRSVHQVHGDNIVVIKEKICKKRDIYPQADGLVTNLDNLSLSIRTADCLPIFFYDKKKHCIGLVHAGWRGTRKHIIRKALHQLRKSFDASLKDLRVVFSASIRQCCYEVGKCFNAYFPEDVMKTQSSYFFDLAGANKRQMLIEGVEEDNIFDSSVCTCCDKNYFSYRREGENTGRMVSLIGRRR